MILIASQLHTAANLFEAARMLRGAGIPPGICWINIFQTGWVKSEHIWVLPGGSPGPGGTGGRGGAETSWSRDGCRIAQK